MVEDKKPVGGESFSDRLEAWLARPGDKTLSGLSTTFADKSFAILIMLLMILPALPMPTGGLTHVLELIAMLLALELMAGRRQVWLPRRWRQLPASSFLENKAIPAMLRQIRKIERRSARRLSKLPRSSFGVRLTAVIIFIFCLAAFVALPFSGLDTLPSLGVVILCLSMILEDGLLWLAGVVSGAAGVILITGLGSLAVHLLNRV